jgi:hypothetical protein
MEERMSDTTDPLVALKDVGADTPTAGDAGHRRVRSALQREIAGGGHGRRRLRLPFGTRSIAMLPAALLVTVTTAAAATTVALVSASPTTLFENNPGHQNAVRHQTVIRSTIRKLATADVPGYGAVQFWIADTEQHGICWGLRAPDETWLTLALDNRSAGSEPGCSPTREQQVIAQGNSSVGLAPTSADYLSNAVKNRNGQWWDLYYGTVTADHAAAVRDQNTGKTASLIAGRYFVLVERQTTNCEGCDNFRAINATGNVLPANYGPQRYRNH